MRMRIPIGPWSMTTRIAMMNITNITMTFLGTERVHTNIATNMGLPSTVTAIFPIFTTGTITDMVCSRERLVA
jgi:hypothetical protein